MDLKFKRLVFRELPMSVHPYRSSAGHRLLPVANTPEIEPKDSSAKFPDLGRWSAQTIPSASFQTDAPPPPATSPKGGKPS